MIRPPGRRGASSRRCCSPDPGVPAFHPRPEDLPEAFGIFPLEGALLLPGGQLPLNIFEPRYLALVEDALGAGRMFGMVQPDPAAPACANGPGLYRIGCLGRLSAFSETGDGRLLITLTGLARFAIAREVEMRRGYRRVEADLRPYLADLAPGASPVSFDRAALLIALRAYFKARGITANWEAIDAAADASLVTTLAMACPFPPAEKQALLEAATPGDRARVLTALLQIGTHGDPTGAPAPS